MAVPRGRGVRDPQVLCPTTASPVSPAHTPPCRKGLSDLMVPPLPWSVRIERRTVTAVRLLSMNLYNDRVTALKPPS